ncbi:MULTISPECIES: restriction endonuclease subunit S [unclassified Microcoleus]|uniref:restriction endonuclease subunit S n=1 Tax=unclassified Microcoleus TaxID=2642155 RepID=UPI002FCF9C11
MRETVVKAEEFKDSPVGRIPKDWDVVPLSSVFQIQSGATPLRTKHQSYFVGGTIPWVKTMDLNEGWIVDTDERITEIALKECSVQLLPPKTVLIAMYGGWEQIGRTGILKDSATTNQAISSLIKISPLVEPEFVLRALQYGRFRWKGIAASTRKDPNITRDDVVNFLIPLPPLDEHRQIAEILDTVDETIAHTSSLIAKLKQMKAGLLHDLLTRGLDENGELRDAIGHPEQFKDSPLGQIPKDWEATTIGEQASTSSGSTPNRSNPKYWQDGTIAWVKTGEINYTFIQDTEEKITQKALNETSLTVYPVDTVLMAMYGQGVTRGKVGILGIESTTNQACAAIIPKDNKLVSRYLFHYLSYYYDEIRSMSHGSNQSNLNERLIASFPIQLPPIKEQIRIVEMIDTYDTRIRTEEAYRDKLKLQKQGLMHDLLTGTVRVNCLGDK